MSKENAGQEALASLNCNSELFLRNVGSSCPPAWAAVGKGEGGNLGAILLDPVPKQAVMLLKNSPVLLTLSFMPTGFSFIKAKVLVPGFLFVKVFNGQEGLLSFLVPLRWTQMRQ